MSKTEKENLRIDYLLLAQELRAEIDKQIKLGLIDYPSALKIFVRMKDVYANFVGEN